MDRPSGLPIRTMVGMVLVKSLYMLPTWTRTVRLVAEQAALRKAIGGAPSVDACYRFTAKLRRHKGALDACIAAVIASLHAELPEYGKHVAVDGSDLPAYANGQRFVSKGGRLRVRFSDPDASTGETHRANVSSPLPPTTHPEPTLPNPRDWSRSAEKPPQVCGGFSPSPIFAGDIIAGRRGWTNGRDQADPPDNR